MFAERIRTAIVSLEIKHVSSGIGSFMTISLGVATMRPQQGSSSQKLVEMADEALYKAKRKGRNRVEVWDQLAN